MMFHIYKNRCIRFCNLSYNTMTTKIASNRIPEYHFYPKIFRFCTNIRTNKASGLTFPVSMPLHKKSCIPLLQKKNTGAYKFKAYTSYLTISSGNTAGISTRFHVS